MRSVALLVLGLRVGLVVALGAARGGREMAAAASRAMILQRKSELLRRSRHASPWDRAAAAEPYDALAPSQEAIDGESYSRPRGQLLLERLRLADERARVEAKSRAASLALWGSTLDELAAEYLALVAELREAQEYVLDLRSDAALEAAARKRISPAVLMRRTRGLPSSSALSEWEARHDFSFKVARTEL